MLNRVNFKATINFVLFQAIWFACILGAANSRMLSSWILFITFMYFQTCKINRHTNDLLFVTILLPLGIIIDSLWAFNGLIEYKVGYPSTSFSPYWIAILWITFALSLNHSLKWIFKYPKLALIFGMFGGPLSYLGAERLGAIVINHRSLTLSLLAISWLMVILMILFVHKRINNRSMESIQHA